MTAYITRTIGSYNWADATQKQAQLVVCFEVDGENYFIRDCVEPDSLNDFDPTDIDIVDAVDAIERSLKGYWINTGRDNQLKTIAIFRANQSAIRKEWLLSEATRHQKRSAIEHTRFQNFMSEYQQECDDELDRLSDAA